MIRRIIPILACLALFCFAAPQGVATERADKVQITIAKLEIANNILPILMTKDQIRTFLPAIEKARQEETGLKKKEEQLLLELETQTNEALKNALEKNQVVPAETMGKIRSTFKAMITARQIFAKAQIDDMVSLVTGTLEPHQVKVAQNILDWSVYAPGVDKDELSDSQKLRIWTQAILMDPLTYDMLVQMSR